MARRILNRSRTACIGAISVVGVLAACGGSTTQSVGSKYVKTASIGAAGGTITISPSDDGTIAGTSITIPANALKVATSISIGVSTQSVVAQAPSGSTPIGPVIDFEPTGTTFAVPVTMTIPVTVPQGAAASRIFVEAVEADGSAKQIAAQVAGGIATIEVSGFTNFGGVEVPAQPQPAGACSANSDCPSGQSCVNGVCTVVDSLDAEVCGPSTCPTGCCDSTGTCQPGTSTAACGTGGVACVGCANGQEVCSAQGACTPTSTDAGSDATDATDATDAGQDSPAACPAGETLCGGVCANLSDDPDNCGACQQACPAGDTCVSGVCESVPACTSNADCPVGEDCTNGVCVESHDAAVACGPSNCAGCCDANDICQVGNAKTACGAAGDSCVTCTNQCTNGNCT